LITPLVFINASEDLIMVDDIVTPLNPQVEPLEKEDFKEAPLNMNVSQRSREKKPSRRMVRI